MTWLQFSIWTWSLVVFFLCPVVFGTKFPWKTNPQAQEEKIQPPPGTLNSSVPSTSVQEKRHIDFDSNGNAIIEFQTENVFENPGRMSFCPGGKDLWIEDGAIIILNDRSVYVIKNGKPVLRDSHETK